MRNLIVFILVMASPVLGWCGASLNARGSGTENVSMGNNDNVTTGDVSVVIDVKPTEDATNDGLIGKKANLLASSTGYSLYQDTNDNFIAVASDGINNAACTSSNDLDGRWTQVVLTFKGGTASVSLYENEVAIAPCFTGITPVGSLSNAQNFITGNTGNLANPLNGSMAYGAFFNKVLTGTEMAELRWKPGSVATTGTYSYWHMFGANTASGKERDYGNTNFPGAITKFLEAFDGPPVGFGGLLPI